MLFMPLNYIMPLHPYRQIDRQIDRQIYRCINFVHLFQKCCKNQHSKIYILIYVQLQAYRYSDCYINLHLPCCVPPSSMEIIFLKKQRQKKLFMGRFYGKMYRDGYMEGLMIRSDQNRVSKMHFPIICTSIIRKSFPQPCWNIHQKIKP